MFNGPLLENSKHQRSDDTLFIIVQHENRRNIFPEMCIYDKGCSGLPYHLTPLIKIFANLILLTVILRLY